MNKRQLALVHVAKSRLMLTDEEYRTILRQQAGVESSKDLDAAGLDAVMAEFQRRGFSDAVWFGERVGMASTKQVSYLRQLWLQCTGKDDDRSLGKWLERTLKVSSLRFLTEHEASRAIAALRNWRSRKAPDAA